MPSTSRHHWGTDIDLNDLNNSYFERGSGAKIYQWLTANASTYGFCQVYSPLGKERPAGYQEEKWHWSYTPLSKPMLNDANGLLTDKKITGFSGSEYATSFGIVKNYIFGVDPSCR